MSVAPKRSREEDHSESTPKSHRVLPLVAPLETVHLSGTTPSPHINKSPRLTPRSPTTPGGSPFGRSPPRSYHPMLATIPSFRLSPMTPPSSGTTPRLAPVISPAVRELAGHGIPQHRLVMRTELSKALRLYAEEGTANEHEVAVTVAKIECELFTLPTEEARSQFRSILFNLKDAKNSDLRRKILEGEISPESLARMTATQLGNLELQREHNADVIAELQHIHDEKKEAQVVGGPLNEALRTEEAWREK